MWFSLCGAIQTRLYSIVAKLSSCARGMWMLGKVVMWQQKQNAHHSSLSSNAAAGVQLRLAKVHLTLNPIC
jgi:hypothetical protein